MIPYFAPDATMPSTSWAPRLAEIKARLVIQSGILLLLLKKSLLELIFLLIIIPTTMTNRKYRMMIP
jgi:hypothetical protein